MLATAQGTIKSFPLAPGWGFRVEILGIKINDGYLMEHFNKNTNKDPVPGLINRIRPWFLSP